MKIRKFKATDAKALSSFIRKTLSTAQAKDSPEYVVRESREEYSEKSLKEVMADRDIYLAIGGDIILGSIAHEGNKVCTLFVDHTQRSKGLGRELLRFVEGKLVDLKAPAVQVICSLSALAFFRRAGYLEVKKSYDRDTLIGVLMEKSLKEQTNDKRS